MATNVQECTLVDFLVNRNKETVAAYLMRLLHRQRVQLVTMDMWHPHQEAVQAALPQATVVIDKFHVLKMANAAVERSYFQTWERSLTDRHRIAFTEPLTAWGNWETHILAYFDHPVTNAYTESLNNLIRATDRLGRGYSFEALRAKMLWTEGVTKTRRRPLERLSPLQEQLPPSGNAQFAGPLIGVLDVTTIRENLGVDIVALSRHIMADQL